MAKIRIGINGMGRIGRQVFRIAFERKDLEVVAANDVGDQAATAHLLKYDSVHGKWDADIKATADGMVVNGKTVAFYSTRNPDQIPWKKHAVDIVMECTGAFTDKAGAGLHLKAGAKKVILSAPCKSKDIPTIVLGVNESRYDPKTDSVVSLASCTTNSLAPVLKALQDAFGIEKGFITTVHAYTNDQRILDLHHTDYRRARAAAINLIPTSTGAAKAIGEVIPELSDKLHGHAVRAPVPTGSITDIVVLLKKIPADAAEVNAAVKKASASMKGILEYSEEDLVSTDIVNNPHSAIFDSKLTLTNGNLVKVFSWYDNEWGYSNRMVDFAQFMGKKGL
jgi:glyceraldehyde 3-phosphate dehydrogenase